MITPEQYDDEHDDTRDDETCPGCHRLEGHADDCDWACVRCHATKESIDNEYCELCHEEGHGWD